MDQDLVETFSGVRGIYGESITRELAWKYALCYCQLFPGKLSTLVISGDSRSSTPVLKEAVIDAFSSMGVERIVDVGIVPIPVAEYAILKFQAQGGVYITASHNEPECNGWKFLKEDGAILSPDQFDRLKNMVHNFRGRGRLKTLTKKKSLIKKQEEAVNQYIDYVLQKVGDETLEKIRGTSIGVLADPNGGSSISVLSKIFNELGVYAKIVNNELGHFARLIEPNAESLMPLTREMEKNSFEFACGFDCDADRVELVISPGSNFAREMGTVVSGNYVLALACDIQLNGLKRQVIVTNDCTSYLVRDIAMKYDAVIKEVEVGEINVVEEMERQKSVIGGEGSNGGVIIPPIKCRDGILGSVLVIKLIAERCKPLIQILESYPKYYSERAKIYCSIEKIPALKYELERYYRKNGYRIKKTGDVTGGMKVLADEKSFVWFRQSKSEPGGVFRIISDGDDHKKVQALLQEGVEVFNKFK